MNAPNVICDGTKMAGWSVFGPNVCGPVVCDPGPPAFLRATSCSNNTAELSGFAEAIRWANSFIPRGARLCILFDSKHAARVTVGTAHAKKNLSLARTCNELLLRLTCNFHVSVHHVSGHAGNTGDECADAAASLGMRGFVSVNNVPVFWPERGLFGQRLFEFHHCLAQHSFHTRERHSCSNVVATSTKNSEGDG